MEAYITVEPERFLKDWAVSGNFGVLHHKIPMSDAQIRAACCGWYRWEVLPDLLDVPGVWDPVHHVYRKEVVEVETRFCESDKGIECLYFSVTHEHCDLLLKLYSGRRYL